MPNKSGVNTKQQASVPPVHIKNFDISKFSYGQLFTPQKQEGKDNNSFSTDFLCEYDGKKVQFQTDWMKMTNYGPEGTDKYPKFDGTPFKDDEKNRYKLPFDPAQKACMELHNFFSQLDEYFDSDEVKNNLEKITGKLASQLTYMPIIKPKSDKIVVSKNPKYPAQQHCDFWHGKLNHQFIDDKRKIDVKLVIVKNDKTTETIQLKNFADIQTYFKYQCDYRLMFKVNKLAITNAAKKVILNKKTVQY